MLGAFLHGFLYPRDKSALLACMNIWLSQASGTFPKFMLLEADVTQMVPRPDLYPTVS